MPAAGPGLDLPDHKGGLISGTDWLFKMLLRWINLLSVAHAQTYTQTHFTCQWLYDAFIYANFREHN